MSPLGKLLGVVLSYILALRAIRPQICFFCGHPWCLQQIFARSLFVPWVRRLIPSVRTMPHYKCTGGSSRRGLCLVQSLRPYELIVKCCVPGSFILVEAVGWLVRSIPRRSGCCRWLLFKIASVLLSLGVHVTRGVEVAKQRVQQRICEVDRC